MALKKSTSRRSVDGVRLRRIACTVAGAWQWELNSGGQAEAADEMDTRWVQCFSRGMRELSGMGARPFTEQEFQSIVATLGRLGRHRDKLMIQLGCAVGYRISELLSLRVGQVWSETGPAAEVVTRRLLKGGHGVYREKVRSRRVVLAPAVRVAIAEHFATRRVDFGPEEFLFRSREGGNRPVCAPHVHRIIVGAALAAGVDTARISTHTLRKTFAARVYAATNRDLIKTQRIMGHTNPMTTARYLESTQQELDLAVLQACG